MFRRLWMLKGMAKVSQATIFVRVILQFQLLDSALREVKSTKYDLVECVCTSDATEKAFQTNHAAEMSQKAKSTLDHPHCEGHVE